jgi:hypothetical protein
MAKPSLTVETPCQGVSTLYFGLISKSRMSEVLASQINGMYEQSVVGRKRKARPLSKERIWATGCTCNTANYLLMLTCASAAMNSVSKLFLIFQTYLSITYLTPKAS